MRVLVIGSRHLSPPAATFITFTLAAETSSPDTLIVDPATSVGRLVTEWAAVTPEQVLDPLQPLDLCLAFTRRDSVAVWRMIRRLAGEGVPVHIHPLR